MTKNDTSTIGKVESIGTLSALTCPECHGALWEVHDQHVVRYRCHTGHAYGADALASQLDSTTEAALYSALRALRENATVSSRVAQRARSAGRDAIAKTFEDKARQASEDADVLHRLLHGDRAAAD